MPRASDHGWWPYLAPMFGFLALVELGRRVPPTLAPVFAVAAVLVPALLVIHHARRTGYPELAGWRPRASELLADIAVGVLGAALWVAPYLWFPALRPGPDVAFDPGQLGAGLEGAALALRALGFCIVTPFVEELFVRSWLARYADVFDRPQDFRSIPIGRYSLRSLATVTLFFTASHAGWEWPVAIAWILLTQLWFYQRRSLPALVLVHAVSNLSIYLLVVLGSGRIPGPDGVPLDLWFFL